MSEIQSKLTLDTSDFSSGINDVIKSIGQLSDDITGALQDISAGFMDAKSETFNLTETTEASSQKQGQSWSRVGKAIGAVALISNGLFKSMVEASPSLTAAFAEMNFMFQEVFMTLGESLAPVINEFVVPAVEALTEFILTLNEETLTLIASGIGLTAMFTGASSIASIFGVSLTALLGPIGLVIAALALLAVGYATNFGGMKDTIDGAFSSIQESLTTFVSEHEDQFERIFELFKELWVILEPIVEIIVEVMTKHFVAGFQFAFEVVMDLIDFFLDFIEGFLKILTGIFTGDTEKIMEGFTDIIGAYIDVAGDLFSAGFEYIQGIFEIFSDGIGDIIGELFGDDAADSFGKFVEMIKSTLNVVISWVNDLMISPLNAILDGAATLVSEIPGVDKPSWSIPNLPTFHGGGIVPGPIGKETTINALGGEVVSNPMRGQTPAQAGGGNKSISVTNRFTFNNSQFTERREQRRFIQNTDMQIRKNLNTYISGRNG